MTLDANQQSQIFYINNNAEIGLAGLAITNGDDSSGGGIYNRSTLTLYNTIVAKNSTDIYRLPSGTILFIPEPVKIQVYWFGERE